MKRGGILAVSLIIIGTFIFIWSFLQPDNKTSNQNGFTIDLDSIPIPVIEYGLNTDSFTVYKDVIKPNEFLANILLKYKIPYTEIDELAKASKEVFDVNKLAAGKNYTILCSKD